MIQNMNDSAQYIPPDEDTKLEDVMAAMDVVDTLRHEQDTVERELDDEGRRQRLLERLRNMYSAQGIDVPDHVLLEGIQALEDERFKYVPTESSWRTKLAHIWVSRSRWGKPMGFLAVLGSLFSGVYFATDVLPAWQRQSQLPEQLQAVSNSIISIAKNKELANNAIERKKYADNLLLQEDYESAEKVLSQLKQTQQSLVQEFTLRVVSKPNMASGVWRIPPSGEGRNYYLIVEAVDSQGKTLTVPITSEENNKRRVVDMWGLRVNEDVFYRIAADKRDDGIIQNNIVGRKLTGFLQPNYTVTTSGSAITDW